MSARSTYYVAWGKLDVRVSALVGGALLVRGGEGVQYYWCFESVRGSSPHL